MADVVGTQFADNARDNVITLMNELLVTISTGFDPKFSFVYDSHKVAKLELNAVTVEIIEAQTSFEGVANGPALEWTMACSCRIHTAYIGDRFDERDTMRLAEGVANKLESNLFKFKDDSESFWIEHIESITNQQEFPESVTMGAEVISIVKLYVCYPQE